MRVQLSPFWAFLPTKSLKRITLLVVIKKQPFVKVWIQKVVIPKSRLQKSYK